MCTGIWTVYFYLIVLYITLYSVIVLLTKRGGEQMEKMYSLKEAAEILSLAVVTLRLWISEGKLASVKIGRTIRVTESEILRLQKGV
jgi:excisionase family DNA binding protein